MFKFELGEVVRIKNPGFIYGGYQMMANVMELKHWKKHEALSPEEWKNNRDFQVIARVILDLPMYDTTPPHYGIKPLDGGKPVIINEDGLESAKPKPDIKQLMALAQKLTIELRDITNQVNDLVNEEDQS